MIHQTEHNRIRGRFDPVTVVMALAIVLLAGFVLALLFSNYDSQMKLRRSAADYFLQKSKEEAYRVGAIFTNLYRGIESLSGDRAIQSYYENKALGMSMEYGLRASLVNIEKRAKAVFDDDRICGESCFEELMIVDKDDGILLDFPAGNSTVDHRQEVLNEKRAYLFNEGPAWRMIEGATETGIVLSLPIYFKKEIRGYVLAWVSKKAVAGHYFSGHRLIPGERFALSYEKRLIPFSTLGDKSLQSLLVQGNDLDSFLSGNGVSLIMKDPEDPSKKMAVYQPLVQNMPFRLLIITPEEAVWGKNDPRNVLYLLIVVTVFFSIVIGFLWQLSIRNASLQANIEEEGKRADAIEKTVRERTAELVGANALLKNEMAERARAEKNLIETQAQLVQSEKLAAIGQLAAGVAHEINNPIAFVITNVDVLGQYVGVYGKLLKLAEDLARALEAGDRVRIDSLTADIQKFRSEAQLDFIEQDATRLIDESKNGLERVKKIINDLRVFARSNRGGKEKVTLESILESVVGIAWNEIKYKAELKKKYGETPPILCDSGKLGQVFVNILVNAAQAIPEHGEIILRTYTDDSWVCADISDTGNGISDENLKKIFDPFFTTKPVGQGTGLGLSLSYDIIKEHGGEIRVRSEVGRGTTFTVALPRGENFASV